METQTLKLVKSQNCEKIGKLGILIKFQKGDITVVLEHDIGTWFGLIFISTIIQGPPLYIETKKCFCWRGKNKVGEEGNFLETMTRHEKRTSYDGKEIIKRMEPILEDMNKNIMKGFIFLDIQSWENIYLF